MQEPSWHLYWAAPLLNGSDSSRCCSPRLFCRWCRSQRCSCCPKREPGVHAATSPLRPERDGFVASKLVEDPRIDPRIKASFGAVVTAPKPNVASREELLAEENTESARSQAAARVA